VERNEILGTWAVIWCVWQNSMSWCITTLIIFLITFDLYLEY
jgi:hypothetical protein